ncbi:MAG TPA: SDR family oxidoreductase [Terriglobia bacterium]|nr:SDR family oxidoreductase [Terriglobia bacterium]
MSRRDLVTGVTGFVGSHLAYRLLKDGHHVTALARGARNTSARDRVIGVLGDVAGSTEGLREHLDRLEVLEGDISQPFLGLAEETFRRTASNSDAVWHCAASLSFTDEEREEIFRMNVGGTQNVLDLVCQTPLRRLHHVSTAYVAGTKELAKESEVETGQSFRNAYEASKCEAELLVGDVHDRKLVTSTIYRPSIVIGDSVTGRATHFHGVYAFIRGLFAGAARLRRKGVSNGQVHLPVRVLGKMTTTLNFVPIDYVVNGMVHIGGQAASAGGTYHLANPHPTPNNLWLPHICRLLGVTGVELVDQSAFEAHPPTRMEAAFQKQMAFYYMYLQGEPLFDCSRTLEALQGTGIACPRVTVEFIERIVGWYVSYLKTGLE